MRTREEFLRFALSLGDVYRDAPFHDDNWILVRHRANRRAFAFTFEREGCARVNLKLPRDWQEFFRSVYPAVLPAYHMNKEHWSTVVLDGSIPAEEIERMTQMSFDLTAPRRRKGARDEEA